jgi:hypothetical protein
MNKIYRLLYITTNVILILTGIILHLLNNTSIGDNILASGIVGLVLYWALDVTRRYEAEQKQLLSDANEQGVVRIYDRRLIIERYAEVRMKTTGSFDIMGFGLRTFIEDNQHELKEWAKKFVIRILVIHPNTEYCIQRDLEENDPSGKIQQDVYFITRLIQDLKNPRIQVRWYKAIPTTNLFRMGDTMFIGPYFVNTRSRNSMTIELRAGGKLFDRYLEHFNRIWNDHALSFEPNYAQLPLLSD